MLGTESAQESLWGQHMISFLVVSVLVVFGVVLIYHAFGKKDVKWLKDRWFTIFKAQIRKSAAQGAGHFGVLLLVIASALLIGVILLCVTGKTILGLNYDTGSVGYTRVLTITTTLFATLQSVILALVALAVTAYVFLNDALSAPKDCERKIIGDLKEKFRRRLFLTCVFSGLCIILILIVDNAKLEKIFEQHLLDAISYFVITSSLIDIIFLSIFISSVVNYEKRLLAFARSYIRVNGITTGMCTKETEKDLVEAIKRIGDTEMLLGSISDNHEPEYRYQKGLTSKAMLEDILIKKLKLAQERGEKVLQTDESIKRIYKSYRILIEVRNCFWVLQNAEQEDIKAHNSLIWRIDVVNNGLGSFAFAGERFLSLNFNGIKFINYVFNETNFQESSFIDVDFSRAKLQNSDFSNTLMERVIFSRADCTGAVFRHARIKYPIIDENTKFDNAVFEECEFTVDALGDKNVVDNSGNDRFRYHFSQILARKANFMNCGFYGMDFSGSVMSSATFADALLFACNFERADLREAVLAHTIIGKSCNYQRANCENISAVSSKWGVEDGASGKLDLSGSRFVKANLAHSEIKDASFHKAYLNDVTFTAANLENCDFSTAFMNNADFTDADIKECSFAGAVLSNSLIIGDAYNKHLSIQNVCFEKAELRQSSIRNHVFINCSFDSAVFDDAGIRDVSFIGCSFRNAHFNRTMLFHVVWRECRGRPAQFACKPEFGTEQDRDRWEKMLR